MVYTPLTGNAQAASIAVIGATHMDTVTPTNPTPPTNLPYTGLTPPTPVATSEGTRQTPYLFAPATTVTGGMQHEGAANDSYFSSGSQTLFTFNGEPYSVNPNKNHPSSDAYTGSTTVFGATGDAVAPNSEDNMEWVAGQDDEGEEERRRKEEECEELEKQKQQQEQQAKPPKQDQRSRAPSQPTGKR